jgi:Phage Connector (GP10).
MSRRRKDSAVDSLYGDFKNNPNRNRKALYERMYVRVLTEICANRFSWNNLPEEIDKRFLELQLFRQALCVFFFDEEYDRYFALRGSGAGMWNMYDNPISFTVTGNSMISRQLQAGNALTKTDILIGPDGPKEIVTTIRQGCVPIWGNTLRTPDWDIVYLQATKLAEIEQTIEVNLKAMRKPFLFAVDDNERQSFMNLWRQHQEGQPVIFGTTALGESLDEKVKLFDMKIDKEIILNLQISKSKIWNETMTLLGINNANQEKRERLVADEVSANDSQIMAVRNSAMSAREYAAEWINKMYGLNVEVEWNETAPMGMTDSFAQYMDPSQSQRMEGMSEGV